MGHIGGEALAHGFAFQLVGLVGDEEHSAPPAFHFGGRQHIAAPAPGHHRLGAALFLQGFKQPQHLLAAVHLNHGFSLGPVAVDAQHLTGAVVDQDDALVLVQGDKALVHAAHQGLELLLAVVEGLHLLAVELGLLINAPDQGHHLVIHSALVRPVQVDFEEGLHQQVRQPDR